MSSFVHISQFDPEKSEGGVAQFARHLKTVVPNLEFMAMKNDWREMDHDWWDPPSSEAVVIADGYYGLGLGGEVKRLITVCHSTYAGWLRDALINPCDGISYEWLLGAEELQERAYKESDDLVAVSESAQEELWTFYRLDSAMIHNGVDVEKFHADTYYVKDTICEVAGDDVNKGADIINELRNKGGLNIQPLGFDGDKQDRWSVHEAVVMPSRHEGGPYAQLEAMAMNLKIVAYRSGYFKSEVPKGYLWSTNDLFWMTFQRLVKAALGSENLNPREWVLENATLKMFQDNWKEFLEVNDV